MLVIWLECGRGDIGGRGVKGGWLECWRRGEYGSMFLFLLGRFIVPTHGPFYTT